MKRWHIRWDKRGCVGLIIGLVIVPQSQATNLPPQDTDGDGLPDSWEQKYGLNVYDPTDAAQDADGDGLTHLQEYQLGTHPRHSDTDGDGLPDGWEVTHGLHPRSAADGALDADGDGLTNAEEFARGTDPFDAASHAVGVQVVTPKDETYRIDEPELNWTKTS